MSSNPHHIPRQTVNVLVLVVVLWFNALAGSGGLSGESIGVIANRYPSTFLPASWVFGIWSLIYLALAGFAVYQALPRQRSSEVLGRIGWSWAANGALNVVWIGFFSFSLFGPALVVMVALLLNLIWIGERIGWGQRPLGFMDRLLVAWPFGLYLAWISVALIANTFQYLTYLEWGGWGIGGEAWSAIMMVVATALSTFMVLHRGNWLFPLVFAWAFLGIGDRYEDVPVIVTAAWAMTLTVLGTGVGALVRRRVWAAEEGPG